MDIKVRKFEDNDIKSMIDIWNEVVEEGIAFPQLDSLNEKTGLEFFSSQSPVQAVVRQLQTDFESLDILHPNNVGRCGHISNASYAVKSTARNMSIGEKLVKDCMKIGRELGFRILQFNAVVKSNYQARHLYEKLGFKALGEIPEGFLMKDGTVKWR